jgi:hypothetical protein
MNEDAVKKSKDPSEYGKTRFLVELFITERFVVTTYADDANTAVERAKASPYRSENGLGFHCKDGVSHPHFDEDYNFQVTRGEVVIDDSEDDS